MIAVWMLYCLAIGLAFVVVGHALERGLHLAGRPTRWAWIAAVLGSYLIPVTAWLRPSAFATFPVPVAPAGTSSSVMTSTAATILREPTPAPLSLANLDVPLRSVWILGSCGMIVALLVATARLVAMRRRWRRSVVDGRDVLISSDVGPAVVGLWSPRIVLPEWTLTLPSIERELILAHEEQHVRAKDPALVAAALVTILVAPWNLALWWHWRRLRLAVEVDCDARVLAQGRSAPAYSDVLLRVGGSRTRPIGAAAFGEPASFLESRIRRMLGTLPRWRWVGVVVALMIAGGAILIACETPRPVAPTTLLAQELTAGRVDGDGVSSSQVVPLLTHYFGADRRRFPDRSSIVWFVVDAAGTVVEWGTAPRGDRTELTSLPTRVPGEIIPRYDTLAVGSVLVQDQLDLPATIIVRLEGSSAQTDFQSALSASLTQSPKGFDQAQTVAARARAVIERTEALGEEARRVLDHRPSAVRVGPNLLSTLEADSGITLQLNEELEQLRWTQRDNALRKHAQRSEPVAFAGARDAIALVIDSDNRLVAHAAGTREPGDRSCTDVLTRLLPAYRSTRFPVSGCLSTEQGRVVVYWGQLGN